MPKLNALPLLAAKDEKEMVSDLEPKTEFPILPVVERTTSGCGTIWSEAGFTADRTEGAGVLVFVSSVKRIY